jgi:hypothetical protein
LDPPSRLQVEAFLSAGRRWMKKCEGSAEVSGNGATSLKMIENQHCIRVKQIEAGE